MLHHPSARTNSYKLASRIATGSLFLCLLLAATAVRADTSLWEISKDGNTMFLGGTIHVLRPSDYPLPEAFDNAFEEATLIGFETDLNSLNTQQFHEGLLQQARYPNGETLADHLNDEAMQALETYCNDTDLPLEALLPFKPSFAMLTMLSLELAKLGVVSDGVDYHYLQHATTLDKPILGLETPEQQLGYLVSMGEGQESDFILHSLQDLAELDTMLDQMVADWRIGNNEGLHNLFVEPLKDQYPAIYQSLLVERNRQWLPTIEKLANTPETELVLVGVAHLIGPDGLLEQLQTRGYSVVQR